MIYSIGEILVDIFKEGNNKTVFPGGAPFNVASNIAFWGGNVKFVGAVGKDEYGKFLLDFINSKKINASIDELTDRYTTQAIVTLTNGERSFKFVRDNGADYALDIDTVKNLDIKKGDIVHVGSLLLSFESGRKFFDEVIKVLKDKKAIISFDVNYRDDIFESPKQAKEIFINALKKVDVIKFTEEELELLTNKKDIKESLKELLNDNQIAAVTLGKDGSLFYSKDKFVKVPSKPIKPVDTTGAGDAFYSYFLYALDHDMDVNSENSIISSLKAANAMGALATQAKGAIGVVPTINFANEFIK